MARLATGAEYLPLLPEEFPDGVFSDFEKCCAKAFTAEQRHRISHAAYLLGDSIYRHAARPNVGEVRKRLNAIIELLETARDAKELSEQMHVYLRTDEVGEALGSLLMPPLSSQLPLGCLAPHAFESRRSELSAAATALRSLFEANYANVRGREPTGYRDVFVMQIIEVCREAGLHLSASFNNARGQRDTVLVRLVTMVANQALECFGFNRGAEDDAASQGVRFSLKQGALEERVRKALMLMKRSGAGASANT